MSFDDTPKEQKPFFHLSIMEVVENLNASAITKHHDYPEDKDEIDDDDDMFLPGFRFHPTDEELVGFYLRRKVENKLLNLDFIKQIDIYKHDPWDLPKAGSSVGENEWYFFCKRGRKYKNSIRPNRVTGSGFWKATGIDRPIYSAVGHRHCIGLKKSLVYYRGSAGKGTKTEWMMHEFRHPPQLHKTAANPNHSNTIAQEAEVWTLCRILKRRSILELGWKQYAAKRNSNKNNNNGGVGAESACTKESPISSSSNRSENYISFGITKHEERPFGISLDIGRLCDYDHRQQLLEGQQILNPPVSHQMNYNPALSQSHYHPSPVAANSGVSSFTSPTPESFNELLKHADWEELRSVLGFAIDDP